MELFAPSAAKTATNSTQEKATVNHVLKTVTAPIGD